MTIEKTNPVDGHDLTLEMPTPSQPAAFGWVRLLNGSKDAGYIYLTSPPVKPRLSSDGSYIVTSLPMTELSTILNILTSEKGLQIRYFDPQSAGVGPSVFLESAATGASTTQVRRSLPDELAEDMATIRAS